MLQRIARISLAALGVAALFATPAAASREGPQKGSTIRVCSKTAHWKCVTTRVRETHLGKQYLSPGGAWRYCGGDCRDQLRRDSIDFWYYHRD